MDSMKKRKRISEAENHRHLEIVWNDGITKRMSKSYATAQIAPALLPPYSHLRRC